MMKGLWKATIVIWSEFDPRQLELEELAREAMSGQAYCSKMSAIYEMNPEADKEWDGTTFFSDGDEEEYIGNLSVPSDK